MPRTKQKPSRAKASDSSASDIDDSSSSSPSSSQEKETKRPKTKLVKATELVKCRYCLKYKCQLQHLKRHARSQHPQFFKLKKHKDNGYFEAAEGQAVPDDPEYQVAE